MILPLFSFHVSYCVLTLIYFGLFLQPIFSSTVLYSTIHIDNYLHKCFQHISFILNVIILCPRSTLEISFASSQSNENITAHLAMFVVVVIFVFVVVVVVVVVVAG